MQVLNLLKDLIWMAVITQSLPTGMDMYSNGSYRKGLRYKCHPN